MTTTGLGTRYGAGTGSLIALAFLMAAPTAMAGPSQNAKDNANENSAVSRVIKCARWSVNSNSRWFGKMGACVSFKRANDNAGKVRPPKP